VIPFRADGGVSGVLGVSVRSACVDGMAIFNGNLIYRIGELRPTLRGMPCRAVLGGERGASTERGAVRSAPRGPCGPAVPHTTRDCGFRGGPLGCLCLAAHTFLRNQ